MGRMERREEGIGGKDLLVRNDLAGQAALSPAGSLCPTPACHACGIGCSDRHQPTLFRL